MAAAFDASRLRFLVVGDIMLDEFLWGDVRRISPEAPVPVVDIHEESRCLGGAANVVNNLVTLGAQVSLCGVVGDDRNARLLRELLRAQQTDDSGLVVAGDRPTTIKTRVIARQQQMIRFDREVNRPFSPDIRRRLLQSVAVQAADVDAVILSDYAKGVLDDATLPGLLAEVAGKIVTVDPKPKHLKAYQRVTCITPNRLETEAVVGFDVDGNAAAERAGRELCSQLQAEAVLITRGDKGLSLIQCSDEVTHIPAVAQEVFDVTGAGDTVIAILTVALAAGRPMVEAARIANAAAGIVVGKLGTAALSLEEFRRVWESA